ncbi:leucine-rich repeat-containing protein 23-like protein [Lasius niger]|uniref:Leucine-rich repeat-containing protein 23-like protein n=1 Tax=Lasius niger TaxID=67767 RepID=A0A0J7L6A4_LASNI|nr:leucine-rich repeat-containing protein 23-like protein [Lasius niger]
MAEFIEEGSYVATSETDEPRSALTREEANDCLHRVEASEWHNEACQELNVSYKNLTDVSVISSHFKDVCGVNVSGNKLTSEALRVLETMPKLEVLQADQNCLTSAELKPMKFLKKLTLNMNELTYAGTSVISHESLKYLELNYNLISTVAFEAEKLPNLTLLELCDNALTTTAENPFLRNIEQEEEGRKYRRIVLMMLPRLRRIDKELVLDQERNEANELLERMQNEGYGFTDFDLED